MKHKLTVLAFALGLGIGLVTSGALADGVTQAEEEFGLFNTAWTETLKEACDLPDVGDVLLSMECSTQDEAVVLILEPGGAIRWERRLGAGKGAILNEKEKSAERFGH